MISIFKGKKRARLLALVAAVAFLLSGAVSFIQPVTVLADDPIVNSFNCKTGKVGESYGGGGWRVYDSTLGMAKTLENVTLDSGTMPEGLFWEVNPNGEELTIWIGGTPKKAGTYSVVFTGTAKKFPKDESAVRSFKMTYKIPIEEADKEEKKDDDDDDSSSSSVSEEERQAEAAKHFAPDTASMTPEQSAGWSLVSREAPSVSSSSGGVTATSAYQGPVCRLGFQLAAPGYSVGHTYNMSFTGAGGSTSMKVPADLVKSGRKFVISFVYGGGVYVSTPVLTPDANGNISFNPALLGLGPNSNAAIAIMYQD